LLAAWTAISLVMVAALLRSDTRRDSRHGLLGSSVAGQVED